MSLEDLQKALQKAASGGTLTLDQIAGESFLFGLISTQIPSGLSMSLTGVTVSQVRAEKFTVEGKGTWLAIQGVETLVSFKSESDTIAGLAMKMPGSFSLNIPGADWFSLGGVSLELISESAKIRQYPLFQPVSGSIKATIVVKGISVPIKIGITSSDDLLVEGDFSSIDFPSLSDLLSFVGKTDGINLPDSLNNLTKIALNNVSVAFNPTTKTVNAIGVSIGSSACASWDILPGVFKINSYKITVNVVNPTIAASRGVGGSIGASLTLGGVDIDIFAAHPETDGWEFSGETEEGQQIDLGALIEDLTKKFDVAIPLSIKSLSLKNFSIGFNTTTAQATGEFTLDFKVGDTNVEMTATLTLIKQATKYTPDLVGKVKIGASNFTITFHDSAFTAELDTGNQPLTFNDLTQVFGFQDVPEIPSSLDLNLTQATFSYDTAKKELSLTAITKYGKAVFVTQTQNGTTLYAFGFNIHLGVTLADIPLVGDKLPDAENLGIPDAGIWVLSQPVKKPQAEQLNTTIRNLNPALPTLPDADITAKVLLSADLQLGPNTRTPLQLPLGGDQTPPKQLITGSTQTSSTTLTQTTTTQTARSDNTRWFNVEKQFGVFQFKRLGISYEANMLMFTMDAAITLGPLTFSMDGLSVGSSLTEFKPKFDLSGLGLSYVNPPLEIMGALLKVPGSELAPGVKFQFDGMLVMKSMNYSLSAIGSYAQLQSAPSLFVFAQLEAALGGPPFFFVTGLMAGFGFNRLLTIPAQDEVLNFPLLALAQPPGAGAQAKKQDPMEVLDILEGRKPITPGGQQKKWITPSTGNYWLAVGIQFTSFELVTSKALLIVEFGDEFQVVLLGLSTMRLPKLGNAVYAYVELQLKAVFKPQDGFFGLTAILSKNSFVIDPACHLTGGFAFYLWFGSNPNAGQFVITIGGYHPAFKPPNYFPKVPRLGFNWPVSDAVSIKGNAYFALTTSCVMAGGGLQVLFHDGDLRAWFTAQADLLISWHPFFFKASISVDIGVSYRLDFLFCSKTVSASIGASLDLWGPPTGGIVNVDLSVISFSVRFGSDSAGSQNDPLKWDGFKSLLPAKNDVVKVTISDGLYKSQDSQTSTSGKSWVVRATNFRFFTQSAIPASQLAYGSGSNAKVMSGTNSTINVKPMNLTGVTSTHTIAIRKDSSTSDPIDVSKWDLQPRSQNVPDSLWGAPPAHFSQIPNKPDARVIPNQQVGYNIQAPPPTIGPSQGLVPLKALAEEFILEASLPISPTVKPVPDFVPDFSSTSVVQIEKIMGDDATQGRLSLFNAMKGAGVYAGPNDALNNMASQANFIFADAPMIQS